jgi:hypothetical protein
MNVYQARRFAEKSPTTARDTMHKSAAAAEEMTQAARQGYFAAVDAVRDFNMKLIEMGQANSMATLRFVQEVGTAKGPTEAAAVWSSHACEHFQTLTEQSRELTALAQRVLTSAAQPLTNSFAQTLHGRP